MPAADTICRPGLSERVRSCEEPPLALTVPDMAALRQGDMTLSFFSLCYVLSGDISAGPAQRPVNRSARRDSAGIPRTPVSRQTLGWTAGGGGIVSAYGRRPVLNFHRHDKSKVISVSLSKSMPMHNRCLHILLECSNFYQISIDCKYLFFPEDYPDRQYPHKYLLNTFECREIQLLAAFLAEMLMLSMLHLPHRRQSTDVQPALPHHTARKYLPLKNLPIAENLQIPVGYLQTTFRVMLRAESDKVQDNFYPQTEYGYIVFHLPPHSKWSICPGNDTTPNCKRQFAFYSVPPIRTVKGQIVFSHRAQKISALNPLTVRIFAAAISPPKTGNRI